MKTFCVVLMLCVAAALGSAPFETPKGPVAPRDWSVVDQALEQWIQNKAYPGCVAAVGDSKGYLYYRAFGNFTYGLPTVLNGDNPAMNIGTLFDLASVSKVVAATTAIAQFYERGELDLNTPIQDILGSQFAANGKGPITVLNCLLHNAGFPPDPDPNYWDKSFGCPQTSQPFPAEDFSCQQKIWNSLMSQTLENPIGSIYVYSDLSFITLMYVVGQVSMNLNYTTEKDLISACAANQGPWTTQCHFEAYVRKYVFAPLSMKSTGFLPPSFLWPLAAPAENDSLTDSYQNKLIQGQVSDGNAYAMGGIAGHAGVFSTAADLFRLTHRIMFPNLYNDNYNINQTTATFFTTEYNHTQSCRALGWSTNDPYAVDEGWDLSCGNLSPTTWTHIGYTGTQICADPTREIFTIFLTNRVYPVSANNQMNSARKAFNNAVIQALDSSNDRHLLSV